MPIGVRVIEETDITISRPIHLAVARDIISWTGLKEDIRIFYPGADGTTLQPGTTINPDHPEKTRFDQENQIEMTVDETYQEEGVLSTAVYYPENGFIYLDEELEAYWKPAYVTTDVTLNFKYYAQSKTMAERWRNDIRNKVQELQRNVFLHDVTYSYLIPLPYIILLKEIHRLRELQAGYGEDWDTYFKNHTSETLGYITNSAASQKRLVASETQTGVLGWFDFGGEPEKGDRTGDAEAWSINMTYKYQYKKPTGVVCRYPNMVHNQLLDEKFRYLPEEHPSYKRENQVSRTDMSTKFFQHFSTDAHTLKKQQLREGYQIPLYDEFIPGAKVETALRLYSVLIQLDPNDVRDVMKLDAVPDHLLNPKIVEFLKKEAPYLTRPYKSAFHVALYRRYLPLPPDAIMVDSNLNIRATRDLYLRETYRLQFSLIGDLSLLDEDAKERLRENPDVVVIIVDTIKPGVVDPTKPNPWPGGYIPGKDLDDIIDQTKDRDRVKQAHGMFTVQTLIVEASNANRQ